MPESLATRQVPQSPDPVSGPSLCTLDCGGSLPDADLFHTLYWRHGAVLLRNTARDDDAFVTLSEAFAERWRLYTLSGRDTVSGAAKLQTVNREAGAISPHSELCHMPGRPEMAWLYCHTPATRGGETTLYDGVELLRAMPEDLRRYFEGRHFRYRRSVPLEKALALYEAATESELGALIAENRWQDSLRISRGRLEQDYVVPAIERHAPSGEEVFVNQLLHMSSHRHWFLRFKLFCESHPALCDLFQALEYRLPRGIKYTRPGQGVSGTPILDDGTIVPRAHIQALQSLTSRLEMTVDWRAGDVLVFDNTRFMHGRRAIGDPRRRILTRFGFPRVPCPRHTTDAPQPLYRETSPDSSAAIPCSAV